MRIRTFVFTCLFASMFMSMGLGELNAEQKASSPTVSVRPDNSATSLDWSGTYTGNLPCADCEGIATKVTLTADSHYKLESRYIGKDERSFVEEGLFTWNSEGSAITLSGTMREPSRYLVGENMLVLLDKEGKRITGALADRYILKKVEMPAAVVPDAPLTETYWKLTHLGGRPVRCSQILQREAHLVLKAKLNRVQGTGGCNRFFGNYELESGNRIRLSRMASTRMACPDLQIETEFLRALEMADNYTIKGNTLQLNKARMAPLAQFEAVYFK
jgi:copper homeostasis protein (lipoprotein)